MLYRLVRPMQRKGSSKHHFVQRIPADVKSRAAGLKLEVPVGEEIVPLIISPKAEAVRLSLRTSLPSEVKVRQAQVAAYLETVWRSLRTDEPVPLSHRQAVALAGELYRGWADDRRDSDWPTFHDMLDGTYHIGSNLDDDEADQWEGAKLDSADLGPIVGRLLLRKGINTISPQSHAIVLKEFRRALSEAVEVRRRQASGDYSLDPTAARFPDWEAPSQPKQTRSAPAVPLKGLVDDWWVEAKAGGRTVSTYESYRSAFTRLADFLEHDDAQMVTPADLVRFKDHRLAQGVSPKTVGDSDLSALRSIFGWAVDNMKLTSNPAEKVRVKRPKQIVRRSKALTAEEAKAILSHALGHKRGREHAKTFAAKRWVPWLCAYTGARLGEMVQLRKQDLRKEGEVWVVTITPEAGTVKDKEVREVVLHAHLIDLGFTAFVEVAPAGYLFLDAEPDKDIRGRWRTTKNRVREFAREVVKDSDVAPNHGWRHLFKTLGREAGIADSVLDAICGHAAKTIGGHYGDVTLRTQAAAIAKFPRFEA